MVVWLGRLGRRLSSKWLIYISIWGIFIFGLDYSWLNYCLGLFLLLINDIWLFFFYDNSILPNFWSVCIIAIELANLNHHWLDRRLLIRITIFLFPKSYKFIVFWALNFSGRSLNHKLVFNDISSWGDLSCLKKYFYDNWSVGSYDTLDWFNYEQFWSSCFNFVCSILSFRFVRDFHGGCRCWAWFWFHKLKEVIWVDCHNIHF